MKIEGEYLFAGPRQAVWELLSDPEALAAALPGTKRLNKLSATEYEGEMEVRIGPVGGSFTGKVIRSNEIPPESCTLTVEGRGAQGFAKGTGHIQLSEQADGTTLMKYTGDVQIGGKLAGVGQRMIDTVSKSLLKQALETLNQTLQARLAAATEGRAVETAPPSQAEFATAVAKDVLKTAAASPKSRWLVIAIGLVIAFVVIGLVLSRLGG
ncbi:MAG: carbon monoxide dehydrogenase subunit G [Anaerolineales bacterium]|nr:carbon monoxide dehydrogenase subunit G [Anaerolineales bacterium]